MPTSGVLLGTYPISLAAGNKTTDITLDPLNYTRNKTLTAELVLTATAGGGAGDTLDVKLQETRSPTSAYFDTRGYFYQVLGSQAMSATAPYADEFTISQDINLVAPDRNERPTGSAAGTELTPGTVRDGPLAPRLRGLLGLQTSHRLRLIQAGAGLSTWTGYVQLFGHHP